MSEKWTVGRARGRFADLLSAVLHEPQAIFNRNKKVAVVVDAETFDEFLAWRESRRNTTLWDDFQKLRQACDEEHWTLPETSRFARPNPFADEVDEVEFSPGHERHQ